MMRKARATTEIRKISHMAGWLGALTLLALASGVSAQEAPLRLEAVDVAGQGVEAQAAGTADLQVRWRYHNAKADFYWYVDNVVLHYLDPADCLNEVCAPNPTAPSPVPDGGNGGSPMQVERLTLTGSDLGVTWDDQCAPASAR